MSGLKIRLAHCIRCGDEFERRPYTGKKYCDGECSRLAKNERANESYHRNKPPAKPQRAFNCGNCGKACTTTHGQKKYCCYRCMRIDENNQRKSSRTPIVNHDDCCGCGGCLGVESRRG